MKKIYFVAFFVATFLLGITTVKADNKLVSWGTCSYKIKDSSMTSVFNKYVDDNIRPTAGVITFGFSDLMDTTETPRNLYTYTNKVPERWYDSYNQGKDIFSEENFTNKGSDLATEFHQIRNSNGNKCPKYLFFKPAGNGKAAHFSDDYTEYCGSDGSGCGYIGISDTQNFSYIIPGEDSWTFTTGTGCKEGANVTIKFYAKDNGELRAKMIVPKTSSAWEISAQKEEGVDVLVRYMNGKASGARAVEKLALEGKLDVMSYSVKKGEERLAIDTSTLYGGINFKTWCYNSGNVTFSAGKECSNLSNKKTEIDNHLDKVKQSHYFIENSLSNSITRVTPPSSSGATMYYDPKTFTTATEEQVKTYSTAIDNYMSTDAFETTLNNFLTYLDGLKDEWCESQLSQLDYYYSMASTYNSYHQSALNAAARAKERLATRAEELGNQELADELNEDAEEIREEAKAAATRISTTIKDKKDQLEGKDLGLQLSGEGCGIISSDMKTFLNTILWYIRIAGVVLAIILSMVDYIKAASSFDDKSMSAANKKMLTRVILVAVLFLVPALLEFVLGLLNISTTAGSLACLK